MGEKYSKFRGPGRVSFDGDSVIITGKRIYQPVFALFILFAVTAVALIYKMRFLYWALYSFVLVSYYVLQFSLLKTEILTLSWAQIIKYEIDTRDRIIALALQDNPKCSPIVFTAAQCEAIAEILREKVRGREVTSHGWTAVEQRYDKQMESMSKFVDRWLKGKSRK